MKDYTKLRIGEKKIFWKNNPVNGEIEILIDGIKSFKMYSENDDTVVKELYWTGFKGWELTSLLLWNSLVNKLSSGLVYDIGTYSGIYTLIAANNAKNNEIHAFDIQNKCIDRVKKNCLINEFNNIFVKQAACTDFSGKTSFYFYEEEGIMTSIAGLLPNKVNNLKMDVDAIKLDDYNNNEKVELIKIDVEGAEISTLRGLKNTLTNFSPDVLIEINNKADIKNVKKMFPRGYNIYDIDETELQLKQIKLFTKLSRHRNYLFTKKSKKTLKSLFSGRVI